MATKEQEQELVRVRESLKVFSAREAELARELGERTSTDDITGRIKAEDEGSTLYDRLTPIEVMEMYQNDRAAWEKMMEQKEQAGLRKLFGR